MNGIATANKLMLATALSMGLMLGGCSSGVSVNGTAQLGYISGGTVKLFDLSNLTQPISTTTSATSTNPINAGSFSFSGVTLSANKYYLVEISGGFDIDVNDDGVIDTTTQVALKGKVYSLAKGSALIADKIRINTLSDMAYQRIKGSLSTLTAVQIDAALTKSAKAYLYDIDGDGIINQNDILAFDPVKHQSKTIMKYKDILNIYVPKLHRGDTDAVKLSSLMYLDTPKISIAKGNMQTVPFTVKASIQNLPKNVTVKWFFDGVAKPSINEPVTVDGIYAVTAKIYQGTSLLKTVQAQVIGSTNVAIATVNVDITKDNTVFVTDASKSSLAGTQIIIPKGALAKNTIITIKKSSINQIPGTGGVGISDVIVMEPSGLTFFNPVQIRLPYNPNVNLTGKAVRIARYSANGMVDYISPLFVDQYTHEVVFETDHFTTFQADTYLFSKSADEKFIVKLNASFPTYNRNIAAWEPILNTYIDIDVKKLTVYDYLMVYLQNNDVYNIFKTSGSNQQYGSAALNAMFPDSLELSRNFQMWNNVRDGFEIMSQIQTIGTTAQLIAGGAVYQALLNSIGISTQAGGFNPYLYSPVDAGTKIITSVTNSNRNTLVIPFLRVFPHKTPID
ncbi:MAG: hypothetical protein Q9M20_08155, partial [Mariprofundaceae bacterium]|nr:hypothetical protein [Mariprofundaceae bacterium]